MASTMLRKSLGDLKTSIKNVETALQRLEGALMLDREVAEGEPGAEAEPHADEEEEWELEHDPDAEHDGELVDGEEEIADDLAEVDVEPEAEPGDDDGAPLRYGPDTTPCRGRSRWVAKGAGKGRAVARDGPYESHGSSSGSRRRVVGSATSMPPQWRRA